MDNERKIKLGFSSIICREDVDKTDEIIAVNDRLQKYCLSKGLLFVDNSDIDASCLTLILVEGGGVTLPPPRWFSLDNSKTVNAVTLEICSIQ